MEITLYIHRNELLQYHLACAYLYNERLIFKVRSYVITGNTKIFIKDIDSSIHKNISEWAVKNNIRINDFMPNDDDATNVHQEDSKKGHPYWKTEIK